MEKFRDYNPEYYDAGEAFAADIPFYIEQIKSTDEILEIGCGTGRVSFPLAKKVKFLWGIDISESMLNHASSKINSDVDNIKFSKEDMFNLNLDKEFDLIIAPFRVIQCCESDLQLQGVFQSIKNHLKPNGYCILNAFNPYLPKDEMASKWINDAAEFDSKIKMENGDLLVVSEKREKIDPETQTLYTDLIYKRHRDNKVIDTFVNSIFMKYFYPDEFIDIIEKNGFEIKNKWGGYKNEVYGEGNELVVAFKNP